MTRPDSPDSHTPVSSAAAPVCRRRSLIDVAAKGMPAPRPLNLADQVRTGGTIELSSFSEFLLIAAQTLPP